ncbi:MAG: hypothetical protein H6737_01080 [Alphaproteobacteria bacterium]|nr:hypothetical protein [Alphaproteobacteria bacterium]
MAGPTAIPPTDLPTGPDAVQQRLARQALVIRSLWFPTRNELVAWGQSGCPVWFMPLQPGRFAVGPRLGAMWASVFSPCLVGEIEADGAGSRVVWTWSYPRTTRAVLTVWAVIVVLWAGAIALGLQSGGLLWWLIATLSTAAAPLVGTVRGGAALAATVPWLAEVLLAPDDEEDW